MAFWRAGPPLGNRKKRLVTPSGQSGYTNHEMVEADRR
jgi:hypothetical protein